MSNERKWTPGPWVVNTPIGEHHPWIESEYNHSTDNSGRECYMSVSGLCRMEDAHLIASAPELYEALELSEDYFCGPEEALEKIRAALAKARGEQC